MNDQYNSGSPFTEGFFLMAKMYCITNLIDDLNKSTAKGISRNVKERLLKRDTYKNTLLYPSVEKLKMPRIGQKNHKVFTFNTYKSGLSSYNDKIWMVRRDDGGWDTHSYGHYNI